MDEIEHRNRRRWWALWRHGCACGSLRYPCPVLRERKAEAARQFWINRRFEMNEAWLRSQR